MIRRPNPLVLIAVALIGIALLACLHGCDAATGSPNFPCGPKVMIFHAKWCQFCPTTEEINQLQTDFPGCEVIDADIDIHPDWAKKYHVTSIPRYFVCDDTGCRTTTLMTELRAWLKELQ